MLAQISASYSMCLVSFGVCLFAWLNGNSAVPLLRRLDRIDAVGELLQKWRQQVPKGHDAVVVDGHNALSKLLEGVAHLRKDPVLGLLHDSGMLPLCTEPSPQADVRIGSALGARACQATFTTAQSGQRKHEELLARGGIAFTRDHCRRPCTAFSQPMA